MTSPTEPSAPLTKTPSNTWEDRRGMFQRGKEVHEPRTLSQTISDTAGAAMKKATPPPSPSTTSNTAARRRSSGSSAGLFGNLVTHKRGSEDYAVRRQSVEDINNKPGVFGNAWNNLFKGAK